MDREAVAQLDRDALIEVVLRQLALIGQLTARIAEMEARLHFVYSADQGQLAG